MTNDKVIKVFVSSTFSDMHRERDLLHAIEGFINSDIRHTGYSVQLVDLRYGIDTAEEIDEVAAERKVLNGCFKAIDECQLFLLFLGDRYGTVFEYSEELEIPLGYEEMEGKSVTHIELIYGSKKIAVDNTLVFIRHINNSPEEIKGYYEKISRDKKLESLKEQIACLGYRQVNYVAVAEDGAYKIEEYYFNKYVQDILEQMILGYIKTISSSISEPVEERDAYWRGRLERERNLELQSIVKRKKEKTCKEFQTVYEQLLWLCIEELLEENDYKEMNERGGTGKVQLEYKKQLLQELPENIDDLLVHICRIAESVNGTSDYSDVYKALCMIAYTQEHMQVGVGCSATEIVNLTNKLKYGLKTYSDVIYFCNNRVDPPGIYQVPGMLGRILAVFVSYGILQYDGGYSFVSAEFAKYLSKRCDEECRSLIDGDYTYKWWFLVCRIQNVGKLLLSGEYEKFHECMNCLWYANKVTSEMNLYFKSQLNEEGLRTVFEKYLIWCIETGKSECDIVWTLYKFCASASSERDKCEKVWIPLCELVFEAYRGKTKSLLHKYVMNIIYRWLDEYGKMTIHCLDEQEVEEIECLEDALYEMFFDYDMNDWEEEEKYYGAICRIRNYYDVWEQLCDVLLIMKLDCPEDGYKVLTNFLPQYFRGDISTERYTHLADRILKRGGSYKFWIDRGLVMSDIQQVIIRPMYQTGVCSMHEMGSQLYKILFDVIRMEEAIYCNLWTDWALQIDKELLSELYANTYDRILKEFLVHLDIALK